MTPGARVNAQVTRRYGASPERVFDAWLDPGLIGRWMLGPSVRDEEVGRRHPLALDRGQALLGVSLDDVLARRDDTAALRYLFFSVPYRRKLNFTWDALAGAAKLAGGALADDPARRRATAMGGYSATAVLNALIGAAGAATGLCTIAWTLRRLQTATPRGLVAGERKVSPNRRRLPLATGASLGAGALLLIVGNYPAPRTIVDAYGAGLVALGFGLGSNPQAVQQNFTDFWRVGPHHADLGVASPFLLVLVLIAVAQVGRAPDRSARDRHRPAQDAARSRRSHGRR